jgi:signal transduction histidine kinase/CheY-like chemotaxis protein
MKLRPTITIGAILVIIFLMLVTSMAVTYIVSRQNDSISREIIRKAFNVITIELNKMQEKQISTSKQVATIEGIGADIKYLSRYKTQKTPRLTLTTYQRLAEHAYNSAKISGNLWKSAFYDREGDLLAFSISDDSGSVLGYAEGYPSAIFQVVTLNVGETLDDKDKYDSWQAASSVAGMSLKRKKSIPSEGIILFKEIEGKLCLQSFVPVKGLEFNQETDQLESVQVGFFMAIQEIDDAFTRQMEKLTANPIIIFHKGRRIAGQLAGYDLLDAPPAGQPSGTRELTNDQILQNEISVNGHDYFQGILPLYSQDRRIASIVVLYSKSTAWKNTQQMLETLVGVSLITILLSIPLIMILTRAITDPISHLRDTMQNVRGSGEFGVKVEVVGSDEISDLAKSFNRMSGIIKQHTDQLESLVEERTRSLQEKTLQLEEAKEKAESANQAKTEFLSNMSHEIRTPMNIILGFAEVLQSMETDEQKLRYIDNINAATNSLLKLINEVLDLSKIEARKMDMQYAETSIRNLFDEMFTMFNKIISDKGIRFTVTCDSDIPHSLILDELHLRKVIINLLGNAVKFTEAGQIYLKASCRKSDDEDPAKMDIVIDVADTGIGIPKEQQEIIFGAFEQVKDQKKVVGGTGLGLSITKHLTEMMGGQISVRSDLEKGSTFTITIPKVKVGKDQPAEARRPDRQIDVERVTFEPAVVLIADDLDMNRRLIKRFLSETNLTFIEAADGLETIEQAKNHHPDLILLDMKMPKMNGYEVSKKLKSDKKLNDIPILAITASALRQDEEKLGAFCDGYLPKPMRRVDLITGMARFLPYKQKT